MKPELLEHQRPEPFREATGNRGNPSRQGAAQRAATGGSLRDVDRGLIKGLQNQAPLGGAK